MQVEVHLLLLGTAGPNGRHMVRSVLHAHHPVTVDHNAVPALVAMDSAAQEAGPETALGFDVARVKHHDAPQDLHVDLDSALDGEPAIATCGGRHQGPTAQWDNARSTSLTPRLPADTQRVRRSLEPLGELPRLGPELTGRWQATRVVLGPWRWMLVVYDHIEHEDRVVVLTIQDARSSSAATRRQPALSTTSGAIAQEGYEVPRPEALATEVTAAARHAAAVTINDGDLLCDLTLDPTRDYQPRGVEPGPQSART